jgi:NIMA (never in mitosis gene a)-related kinase
MSEKDRRNAEMEVQFLKVLVGPTLIKYHESFKDNNIIYIVMEYAEGGSLEDVILKRKMQSRMFEYEEIMTIMAQITLGLMSIHGKQIMHRDIKTQNIFVTKEGLLKIGDFGISRQL